MKYDHISSPLQRQREFAEWHRSRRATEDEREEDIIERKARERDYQKEIEL